MGGMLPQNEGAVNTFGVRRIRRAPALRSGGVGAILCASWIIWNLTGGVRHVTDVSNASRTLLLNVHSCTWDDDILGWLGIPRTILPELLPSGGAMGTTDSRVFFGERIPIAGDAGDQHAATFGQACFRPGMAKNTYGTALALMMNIGETFALSRNGLTTDLAWKIGNKVE